MPGAQTRARIGHRTAAPMTPTTERCTLAGGNYTHTRLMDGNPFASMATCAAPERGDLCAAARAGAAGRLPGFAEVSAVRGMALR
jgi:hypothetical protein